MAKTKRIIINRFRELLAIKERKEKRTISQREVAAVTGIAKTTVDRYARNEVLQYDVKVLLLMVDYLECGLGDFLAVETEEIEDPEIKTPLIA